MKRMMMSLPGHWMRHGDVIERNPLPMKTLLHLLLGLCVGLSLTARVFADGEAPKLSSEEMDKLVAPIALYPDSLVAIILPASTTSSDVVLAARFLSNGGQPSDIDSQPWAESVRSLAHYPEVVQWMDENLDWTQQLGDVFSSQPSDVMAAIQRLRVGARANGLLTDTPQQRVVVEQETVYIEPATPDVIYIPHYEPEYVWMRRPCPGPFITFGVGFGVGDWLFFGCDWSTHVVCMERRGPGWHYVPGWRPPVIAMRARYVRDWHPDPRFHPVHPVNRPYARVAVVPRPIGHPGPDGGRAHSIVPGHPEPRGHGGPGEAIRHDGPPSHFSPPTRPNVPPRPQSMAAPRHFEAPASRAPGVRSGPPVTPAPPAKTQPYRPQMGGGAPAGGAARPAGPAAAPKASAPSRPSAPSNAAPVSGKGGPGGSGRDRNSP